ncbi:NAD-glutamate dehydrogenase [Terrarubrum flagellatum]|uniref:NAD-glutamate dehydrogenase n=1 Tax=Terrirubrum flagellatum TaxID=2895980 RepID=UPI00314561DD
MLDKKKPAKAKSETPPKTSKSPPKTQPSTFADLLFARASAEDISAFDASFRKDAAAIAYSHLSSPRAPQTHNITLSDLTATINGQPRDLTLIEIVNDNMPFLLDSTLAEIAGQGIEPLLVLHPILAIERDAKGAFVRFAGDATSSAPEGARRESLIEIVIDRPALENSRQAIAEGLDRVYRDVRVAVADWVAMRGQLASAGLSYRANPPPLPREEISEAIAFLDWLAEDNFTFLGLRVYKYPRGDAAATPVDGSGLGILRDPDVQVMRRGGKLLSVTPEIRAFLARPAALIITKANVKSRVHRPVHLDYVGVKLFSADGKLEGEMRLVGLFSSNAYIESPSAIPYIRRKITEVAAGAGYDPTSHSGRALMHVLENYPRDELFQVDAEALQRFAQDILALYERPRVRALARIDTFDRFVSVIVFVPKDRYDTAVRKKIGDFLASLYKGRVSAAYPSYPEGPLARTHYIIGRDEGKTPVIERATLEAGILGITRTWSDALRDELISKRIGDEGRALGLRYAEAFNAAYRESFSGDEAVADIAVIEQLSADAPRAVDFYRRGEDADRIHLKLFVRGAPIPLSERVPVLENIGFRVLNERTYRIAPANAPDAERVWMHDMLIERPSGAAIDLAAIEVRLSETLLAVLAGDAESDGLNALTLEAGLPWRSIAMLRTLTRYMRQLVVPYTLDYMASALVRNGAIAAQIVELFTARFDPAAKGTMADRITQQNVILGDITAALDGVSNLDEDRILRRLVNLVQSALRTSFYQLDASGKPRIAIACKFDSHKVEGMPLPKPFREIFVYAPRVEGVHLRFGKVARGGLRWSDRPQDFRTEVLGLVKAQQVKNAVIVPVGAKGGFFAKKLPSPSDRQAWMAEGVEAYKLFVSTLLDLTDNLVGEKVVPPALTVRHDEDDPYLVVAADKGTATFSDIANAISIEHGHWLGDAFASGGSVGYDHKKMGITARGAWEAVKRHFREIDIDIQTQPITVVGVGDMSGDVFGNGALLSQAMKIVAAFDHRDIFIDPTPDAAASWKERQRLFDLPRSSWQDYDKTLISQGGGVYSRSAKSIVLSEQARVALGIDRATMTPAELMNAILRAPADLLWFGGIGTYIRATNERDAEVGDRANDAIRIAGVDLRCKVIGEGANLGCTQLGRIEAAKRGVKLNTDAIDNSAGVNTSDVEVNIKIALARPAADGRLPAKKRDTLLASMTDEVGQLVLRNNYLQTLALSLAERRGPEDMPFISRFMRRLEAEGRLDRTVETLPDDATVAQRAARGEGMTRPELAVILAYAKLSLHDIILSSSAPDEPYLAGELNRYFPSAMRAKFADEIATHRLRREIVSTQLANAIVNRGGPTIIERVTQGGAAAATDVALAYAATRDSLGLLDLNIAIDALDGKVRGVFQLELYARVQQALLASLSWFAAARASGAFEMSRDVETIRKAVSEIVKNVDTLLPHENAVLLKADRESLVAQGVPDEAAAHLAALDIISAAPGVVRTAQQIKRPVADVMRRQLELIDLLKLEAVRVKARAIAARDEFEQRARDQAVAAIDEAQTRLVATVAAAKADSLEEWRGKHARALAAANDDVASFVGADPNLARLIVAASSISALAKA